MPHSRDEGISVEYDAFSSVEIVLGFFKIKSLTKVIIISYLSWFLDSYIGYFPKAIFIHPYTVTFWRFMSLCFASVGALRLRNVPGKRFSLVDLGSRCKIL